MRNRFARCVRDQRGFTLIELLVVILIIGILAAIAIPSFVGQVDRGKAATAQSAAKSAYLAAQNYYVEYNSYAGITKDALAAIDPSLRNAPWSPAWCGDGAGLLGTATVLCIAMRSTGSAPVEFEIRRDDSYGPGEVRLCSEPGKPGCKTGGVFGWGAW